MCILSYFVGWYYSHCVLQSANITVFSSAGWASSITSQYLSVCLLNHNCSTWILVILCVLTYWWTLITNQQLGQSDLIYWVYRSCAASGMLQSIGCLLLLWALSSAAFCSLFNRITTSCDGQLWFVTTQLRPVVYYWMSRLLLADIFISSHIISDIYIWILFDIYCTFRVNAAPI